jgi:large subunit ribosomal protein L13
LYRKHSGYQGGLKEKTLNWMMSKNPNVVLENSIYKMLPKNRMRDVYMSYLHCYPNAEHKHQAQTPEALHIDI